MAFPSFTEDATFPDIGLTAFADALTHVRRPRLFSLRARRPPIARC